MNIGYNLPIGFDEELEAFYLETNTFILDLHLHWALINVLGFFLTVALLVKSCVLVLRFSSCLWQAKMSLIDVDYLELFLPTMQ